MGQVSCRLVLSLALSFPAGCGFHGRGGVEDPDNPDPTTEMARDGPLNSSAPEPGSVTGGASGTVVSAPTLSPSHADLPTSSTPPPAVTPNHALPNAFLPDADGVGFDPWLFGGPSPNAFAPEDVPELLSLYLDMLLLGLVDPAGATSGFGAAPIAADVTYLEQVCRDSGLSDPVCRRRYGGW